MLCHNHVLTIKSWFHVLTPHKWFYLRHSRAPFGCANHLEADRKGSVANGSTTLPKHRKTMKHKLLSLCVFVYHVPFWSTWISWTFTRLPGSDPCPHGNINRSRQFHLVRHWLVPVHQGCQRHRARSELKNPDHQPVHCGCHESFSAHSHSGSGNRRLACWRIWVWWSKVFRKIPRKRV